VPKKVPFQQTGDRQVNQLQQQQAASTQQLRDGPFGNGNLVTNLVFQGGDQQSVPHGLGRAFVGFIIVDFLYNGNSGNAYPLVRLVGVDQDPKNVPDPTKYVQLYCPSLDGPNTYAIWFY
jgi:hypothetical protein